MSTLPIEDVRTHIDDYNDSGKRIFSRDCLEAVIRLPDGERLTVFINHLKSKLVKRDSGSSDSQYHAKIRRSHGRRESQAQRIADIVEERFAGQHDTALYAVVGDFNDTSFSPYMQPLITSPHLTDIVTRHLGIEDSWTYYWQRRNRGSQIDFILTSHALTDRVDLAVMAAPEKKPYIERGGLAYME